ncbi:hypothetical protein [Frigoriflavimonas asaccharolytica]|uniref:Uncharacterized protein n=1 Tax=Frigoriflavimonas asaccharolytica TaxID=2735899 RepID=A0A8J8K4F7_9FLAO|nr:hypothetical protein [Frigoriflavimonas asaccharolytica]NRS91680.1 hypothetical protein [Frigoriflavimonas asaccharolytica]
MRKYFVLFLVLNASLIFSQQNKTPIIYAESIFGYGGKIGGDSGFLIGGEANYQNKNNLFSARYINNAQINIGLVQLALIIPFPVTKEKNNMQEYALLYGKRWVVNGHSFSVLGGISIVQNQQIIFLEQNQKIDNKENFIGFPFEANFSLFKSKKAPFRVLYGLIPIGKPTTFGRSFGIKLVGNISKKSYVGLGFVYGLGIHKEY